ncbi:MAG: thiamine pyrophosphate-dependent enzyme [Patescibacteria group bacterium]
MDKIMPTSWRASSKPHLFCPGCGHAIVLKQLGFLFDEMNISRNTTFGIDIGCSLLAWDFFDIDTVQTHHGRTTPTMVGFKTAKPTRTVLAYMGDGAAYAIGLQSIIHAAYRNDPVTVITVNNENYAMTGGQMSPETLVGTLTTTTPSGKPDNLGPGLRGPELISQVASSNAYIARASISNPIQMKLALKKAIENQMKNNAFSFLEILSICPTNWKTNAKDSFAKLNELEKYYSLGQIERKTDEKESK